VQYASAAADQNFRASLAAERSHVASLSTLGNFIFRLFFFQHTHASSILVKIVSEMLFKAVSLVRSSLHAALSWLKIALKHVECIDQQHSDCCCGTCAERLDRACSEGD